LPQAGPQPGPQPGPPAGSQPGLEATSPYELRVDLGKGVPESDVRTALATGDMGFLHSFTTGSAVDGPGIRVVAWTAGCQWRCLYCHNPDTWTMSNGIPVTVAKATEQLMQHRFVVKVLTAAHDMGIHTALDSNGYYGHRLADADLDKVSLVLLDLKGWDPERHKRLTGMENGPTLEFARRLADRKLPVWVRFVLVPGLTDDPEEVTGIARFAAGLGNVERVDVLPFHQMGRYKWERLGLTYALGDVEPPSTEVVDRTLAIFRSEGLTAY
jgi:pyruvate formate lyase activating enzyme